MDEDSLMRLGVLLDSAAGHEYLLSQISDALDKSFREMSRLRDEWVEGLGVDRASLTEHLREFHRDPRGDSAIGYVAQLDCDLTLFQKRYQAAVSGTEVRLWDAVIVTYANARITALRLSALAHTMAASDDPPH